MGNIFEEQQNNETRGHTYNLRKNPKRSWKINSLQISGILRNSNTKSMMVTIEDLLLLDKKAIEAFKKAASLQLHLRPDCREKNHLQSIIRFRFHESLAPYVQNLNNWLPIKQNTKTVTFVENMESSKMIKSNKVCLNIEQLEWATFYSCSLKEMNILYN